MLFHLRDLNRFRNSQCATTSTVMSKKTTPQPKVLLIILDGWGLNKHYKGNAVAMAKTPTFDKLMKKMPLAYFETSGESVGLPEGQMGTSEVNHFTIGAGKVIFQDLVRINRAIKDNSFFNNPTFLKAFEYVKKNNSTLHVKGLVSPGGVHSHQDHLLALVKAAKQHGVTRLFIHVFTDGRDTLQKSGIKYIQGLEKELKEIGLGQIASISGRYYAMDRDHNWERTDKTFELLINRKNGKRYKTASEAIENSYQAGITDEFIEPALIEVDEEDKGQISSNDAVIFINFRNDRPRQLTERFLEKGPKNVKFVTMTQYNPNYNVEVAFPPQEEIISLGQLISEAGLPQLRVTETEKFAHLTFFLNCKKEEAWEGEDRFMLDSNSDIKTHDEKPEMRATDITDHILMQLQAEKYAAIFTNICNGDMIGHTGNIPAAIKGCEAVDQALTQIIPMAQKHGYDVIVTADHGNCEEMLDESTGDLLTSHSLNPVPFIVVSKRFKKLKKGTGTLIDVAPTILTMLGLPIHPDMTGKSLV